MREVDMSAILLHCLLHHVLIPEQRLTAGTKIKTCMSLCLMHGAVLYHVCCTDEHEACATDNKCSQQAMLLRYLDVRDTAPHSIVQAKSMHPILFFKLL